MVNRCGWSNSSAMQDYHDKEWGVPLHDDPKLFEFLTLEGAQAGLSWSLILGRRDNYRKAFDNFDIKTVAEYDDARIDALLGDAGIIRNRGKIVSVVTNARAILQIQSEFGSFDAFVWGFVDNKPIQNTWNSLSE